MIHPMDIYMMIVAVAVVVVVVVAAATVAAVVSRMDVWTRTGMAGKKLGNHPGQ